VTGGLAWVRALLAVAAAVATVAGALLAVRWVYQAGQRAGHQAAQAEAAEREAVAQESARLRQRAQETSTERIDHDTHQTLRASAARAAAALADARGLRDALETVRADAAASDAAATSSCDRYRRQRDGLAELLAEGGDLLAAGQEAGGRLAAAHAGLRAYVAQVCRLPVN
jgi:hypothetical protein